ncbi:aspartate kinase [Desulfobacterales bacterium HSG17]|nr:aspartate kinase [Desulfobacterales bacterium HSG17]
MKKALKVIKVGGGCLNGNETIAHIVKLIQERGKGHVFVVSALNGVTDLLIKSMDSALENEENIPGIISHLKTIHMDAAKHTIKDKNTLKNFSIDLNKNLLQVERFYYGLNFTREISLRMKDMISSFGERFSAQLLTAILQSMGCQADYLLPHKIGMLTDGKFGDATANLNIIPKNFDEYVKPLLTDSIILFIPGFFGISEKGDITTFGRGGSDYSAAVVAAALNAEVLEVWKDTQGFMSADPKMVPEAQLLPILSYEEAAELAYFGARILHARSVEPVRAKKINIAIKNTLNPDAQGSLIANQSPKTKTIIKSVAHDSNIGILKVYASGVGARPGILALVANCLTEAGINIKSVVTSHTCISLLLEKNDLEQGRQALMTLDPRPYRKLTVSKDKALISIVGDGLHRHKGIAAKCFSAVADCNINIDMISFGPSRCALYFITKNKDVHSAVNAIHSTFFSSPRCY